MNSTWENFIINKRINLEKNKFINKNSHIFTAGSCFAVEIRKELINKNFKVFPNYFNIDFDKKKSVICKLPLRDNVNHYHTYSILYELMKFHKLFNQDFDDCWTIKDNWFGKEIAYQDPYRTKTYSNSTEELFNSINKLNSTIFDSLKKCEVFIFTLGLTEVWKKKNNELVACHFPGYVLGGGHDETYFYPSTYEDNLNNLRDIVKLSKKIHEHINIIFTVSPVPLTRTFRNIDVTIANEESKSILRSAVSQIITEFNNVHYFPAYEFCRYHPAPYKEDGRHIKLDLIKKIVNLFEEIYIL